MNESMNTAPGGLLPDGAMHRLDRLDVWAQPGLHRAERLPEGLALDRVQGAEIGLLHRPLVPRIATASFTSTTAKPRP